MDSHLGFCRAVSGEARQIKDFAEICQRSGAVLLATFLGMDLTGTCLPLGASTLPQSNAYWRV